MSGPLTAPEPSAALSNGADPSMSTTLMTPLNELQSLAHTLFQSLSPIQTKPPPPPPLSAFLQCDDALSSAVNLAQKHQIKQRRIDALEVEVLELEARWRIIATELEKGKRELEELIDEGEKRVTAIEEAKKGGFASSTVIQILKISIASIPYPELLTYAQSISAFTSAPPNMPALSVPGQPPPPLFFPPFPNEEKMRRGRLNAEAPLGLLGETHSVGRRKLIPLPAIGSDPYFSNSADNFASARRGIPPSGPQHLQARSSWAADPVFRSGFGSEPRFVKLPDLSTTIQSVHLH